MTGITMFFLIIIVLVYFIPFLVAHMRNHKAKLAIFMANLFLGWILLPWVFILIWACNSNVKEK
nr:MAG: superinfection immunity protein [Bacteriophage sp.]